MQVEPIALLRKKNARITRARSAIVNTIFSEDKPISAPRILVKLQKESASVNKTTVYRELSFLVKSDILREVFLRPNIIHYESALLPHHHHLVCNNCGKIEGVDCVVDEAKLLLKTKPRGFKLENHKFEMYGACVNCH